MRKRRFLVLVGVALTAAVIVPAALEVRAYRQRVARGRLIDAEHCDRIEEGMTADEVRAMLGGPPGDFATLSVTYPDIPDSLWVSGERSESWSGDQGQIVVAFDGRGAVCWRHFEPAVARVPPRSLAARVRAWLRRLWP
jgi:hypothetical protein